MHEVVAGSQEALGLLYDRHVDGVFATARRIAIDRQVAEEVVQETFLTLWNRAELYDPRLGSLATWLRRIARNRALDRLRAAARRPRLHAVSMIAGADEPMEGALERLAATAGAATAGGAQASNAIDPEDAALASWRRERIRDALGGMPVEERTVIVMAYDEELTQSEIAARLGWPLGTVKTRTRRALSRLRAVLATELGADAEASVPARVLAQSGGGNGAR